MRDIFIMNGALIAGRRIVNDRSLLIRGGLIHSVGRRPPPPGATVIDASGLYVSPGFIDCHIHGEARKVLKNEIPHGTTSVVIAISCAPLGAIYDEAARLKDFIRNDPLGASVIGFRLEGPYINPLKAGAQDRRYIRGGGVKELSRILARCGGPLRIMTIAPELGSAGPMIRLLRDRGVIASIGHTYADYKEARRGVRMGISHATHIFNAMRSRKEGGPGAAEAALSDPGVVAEVIPDLVHVGEKRLRHIFKKKGAGKTILVTDSIAASGGSAARRTGGAYRFRDGRLAGSSITMMDGIRNVVTRCGAGLAAAVYMATMNPARLLGVDARKGSLEAGKDADLVIFDRHFNVKMTVLRGRIAHRSA
jgi:N-acetylglucosamine-6-phosphate deacetylase